MKINIREKYLTIFIILIGIMVATILVPKDSYFFVNFAYFWGPQAIVLMVFYLLKFHGSIIAGTSLVLTLTLIYFSLWISSSLDPMAANGWLGYLFTVLGAFVGALLYGLITRSNVLQKYTKVLMSTILFAGFGVVVVMYTLCTTVIYCRWF